MTRQAQDEQECAKHGWPTHNQSWDRDLPCAGTDVPTGQHLRQDTTVKPQTQFQDSWKSKIQIHLERLTQQILEKCTSETPAKPWHCLKGRKPRGLQFHLAPELCLSSWCSPEKRQALDVLPASAFPSTLPGRAAPESPSHPAHTASPSVLRWETHRKQAKWTSFSKIHSSCLDMTGSRP